MCTCAHRVGGVWGGMCPLRSWKIFEFSYWICAIWWILLGKIHVITNVCILLKQCLFPPFLLLSLFPFPFSFLFSPFSSLSLFLSFVVFPFPFSLLPFFPSFSYPFPFPILPPSHLLVSKEAVCPLPPPSHWLRPWICCTKHSQFEGAVLC